MIYLFIIHVCPFNQCKVLPRVHQILRHLCYAPVQKQCISVLSNITDQAGNKTKNESNNVIADEIATTTSMLLHKLDHSIHTIIEDMVNLLSDLSMIANSNMIEEHKSVNDNDENDGDDDLQIRIFTKTIEMLQKKNNDDNSTPLTSNNYEQIMFLEVTSEETLLMLQTAIQKSLLTLLLFEYQKRTEDDQNIPDFSGTKDDSYSLSPFNLSTSLLSDAIDHNVKITLMASMRQILLSPIEQSTASSGDSDSFKILAMRNKVTAVFFLSYVIGDFIVTCPEKFGLVGLRVEMNSLVLQSILSHLRQQSESWIDYDDNVDLANLVESDKSFAVCEHYSSLLNNLLRDTVVCPPYKNKKSGQYIDFRILLDCLPFMPDILRTNADNFASTKRLCRMILRAIHVTLHDTSNDTYSQENGDKKKYIHSLQSRARIYCSSKKLFPYLFDLMMNLKVMNIVISIIDVLFNDEYCTNILNRACQMLEEQCEEEEYCSAQENHVADDANENSHPENSNKLYSHIPKRQRIAKMQSERSGQTNQSFPPQLQITDAARNSQESNVLLENFYEVVDVKDNGSTECLDDSSLIYCLLQILEKALHSAKQIVHNEVEFQAKNNNKNLKRRMNLQISSVSVKTMCCTVRVLESGISKEIFSYSEAFRTIRKYTWKALFLISESRYTNSDAAKVGEESNIISESLLGVGFHFAPDPKGHHDEDWKAKTLGSISKYTLKYWRMLCSETYHHQSKELDRSSLGTLNSLPRIHPSYTELSLLTQDQGKLLCEYQKKNKFHCDGRCKTLSCKFGTIFPILNSKTVQSSCLCALISSHGSTCRMRVNRYFSTCTQTLYEDKFIDDCTSFLLEDFLHLSER